MRIRAAHLQTQGISFMVFEANTVVSTDAARAALLDKLVIAARRAGKLVEKAALAYVEGGNVRFFGTPDLVSYLAANGVDHWTHTFDV